MNKTTNTFLWPISKRKELGLKLRRMYWVIGRKSELSLENKLLIYKTILKPIWTYGIPLWVTASNSNIEILQRFQNEVLRSIVNAPWFVPNTLLHTDLQIPTVKTEITNLSIKYREKLTTHPKELTPALLEEVEPRRLKCFKPTELTTRFSQAPPADTRAFEDIQWDITLQAIH
jgi:hypothetical protein